MRATVGERLRAAVDTLAAAGVPEPRADAEVLMAYALTSSRPSVVARSREALSPPADVRFSALVERRAERVPVFYLTGRREFWSLDIDVDPRVLIPRPETELLVETTCRLAPDARQVLECGTGSGALAAALAAELPRACVVGTDRSRDALAVASCNLRRLAPGASLVCGDWLTMVRADSIDVVVANPPYVPDSALDALASEVRDHEPREALVAGQDGLRDLAVLIDQAPSVLRAGGWVVLEMGIGQAVAVAEVARARKAYRTIEIVSDHAGIERVLAARRR